MKKIIIIFSLIALNYNGITQPVIPDGSHVPAVGFTAPIMSGPATVSPGSGGAAIVWDFSSLALSNVGTYAILNPATTPVAATYPSGTFALSVTPTGSSALYSYYIINTGGDYELANSVTTTTGVGRNYTPGPRKILKFPFNYTDTFTSPYATSTYSGHDFFRYDGYGTLITPWATYHNVVRIKDSFSSSIGYSYNWYTLDPLVNIFSFDSFSNSYTGLNAAPAGSEQITIPNSSVITFPNPFTNTVTVKIEAAIGLENCVLTIADAAGRIVKRIPVTSTETVIQREGLSSGLYFYTVVNNSVKIVNGKLLIQ